MALDTGLSLGPYVLGPTLGSTGLALCYTAHHEGTGRPAAVKLFRAYFAQAEEATGRFLADLERARDLPPHPALLRPLEWGWARDQLWVAAEPAAGPSLAAGRPPDLQACIHVVRDVATALEQALSAGMTHRNLKPSNVFWDGRQGQVSDFAIATLAEQAHALIRTSLGTPQPAFMAPEYATAGIAGPQSETFSLAVLAYWLLTGEVPFPAATREALAARAMAGAMRLPSAINPALPGEVDRVLQRALAPFPPVRPAGPGAFAEALAAAVNSAGPPPAGSDPGSRPAPGQAGTTSARSVPETRVQQSFGDTREPGPAANAAGPAGTPLTGSVESRPSPVSWVTGETIEHLWRPAPRPTRRQRLARLATVGLAGVAAVLVYAAATRQPVPAPPSSSLAATSVPGAWTLPRYDLGNTAHVPVATAGRIQGRLRWQFQTAAPFGAPAAAADDFVYAATGDNRVVALDQASGALRWSAGTTGPVDAAPVVAGQFLYIGLRDARVLALDRATGEQRWEFRTRNPIVSGGVVDRGVLYQGSGDSHLYALDAVTGTLLWQFQTGSWIVSPPALTEDAVIVISRNGWVHFLDRATGLERFTYNSNAGVHGAPVLADGAVHFAAGNRRFFAVDVEERSTFMDRQIYWFRVWCYLWQMCSSPGPPKGHLWSVRLPGRDYSSPAIAGGRVYIGAGTRLLALEQVSGRTVWEAPADGLVLGSPIVSADTVYAGADDGRVYAVDAASGETRWTFQTGARVRAAPALAGGLLLVASEDGTLYALE